MRLLIVVEGGDDAVAAARHQAAAAGFQVRESWEPGPAPTEVACTGVVADLEQAAAAVLAAVRGASVIVEARAPRDIVDRVCDDLRRFGPVEHRLVREEPVDVLSAEQRELLLLVARGLTMGDVARRLHLSRRTADRRLAAARQALGVTTTTEAVLAVVRARP